MQEYEGRVEVALRVALILAETRQATLLVCEREEGGGTEGREGREGRRGERGGRERREEGEAKRKGRRKREKRRK